MTEKGNRVFKGDPPKRLGEEMLDEGLINEDQLRQVLARQSEVGGRLGSLLIEMDFIAVADLLGYLSRKFDVQGENLYERNIDSATLGLLSMDEIKNLKVLPLQARGDELLLGMVNPGDVTAIKSVQFSTNKKVVPAVVPWFMLEAAIHFMSANPGRSLEGSSLADLVSMERSDEPPRITSLLRYLAKTGSDDMLLCAGAPPSVKSVNVLRRLALPPLTPGDCERYAREMLSSQGWEAFSRGKDYNFSATYRGIGRFRVAVYSQRSSVAIALRPIADELPSFEALNLPEWLRDYALRPHGLIMITGPAGHGMSTTLAAMVDVINSNRGCNIITLEDPVEYLFKHKQSNICQREVGRDVASFAEGMRHIFRQAPDVIVIGEMRDKETFRIALQAATSGHLVLTTAHAASSTSAIESVVHMFEPHEQEMIRWILSDCLLLSLSQRLVPKRNREGRILAMEKLVNTHRIKKFIREGHEIQIRTQFQTGSEEFSSIDLALAQLVQKNRVRQNDALVFVEDREHFPGLVAGG